MSELDRLQRQKSFDRLAEYCDGIMPRQIQDHYKMTGMYHDDVCLLVKTLHALQQPLDIDRLSELEEGLRESVSLQSHYAGLLNQYDGGKRLQFADVAAWLARIAKVKARKAEAPRRINPHRGQDLNPEPQRAVCGFIPPTPGYAPCTRDKGHDGPCAHELS